MDLNEDISFFLSIKGMEKSSKLLGGNEKFSNMKNIQSVKSIPVKQNFLPLKQNLVSFEETKRLHRPLTREVTTGSQKPVASVALHRHPSFKATDSHRHTGVYLIFIYS